MLKWGAILGIVGFVGGFVGPVIFTPEANQGPLLGIFITGPLGFVLGLVVGSVLRLLPGRRLASDGSRPLNELSQHSHFGGRQFTADSQRGCR
ncbi:hypothetical protein [Mesorhizobium sp. WSM4884]|uniref:hypothetical protein n=1 Tax=Mesorhizobium sp. WSM4884 TaxID=3038542 RepID=UPI0024169DAF|nr:hypothetical protein [Mesorhizobium sp. WSM4884]MDG4883772.1 hypothetical protein [Mesorhizobium sp. WSM4884]